MGICAGLSDCRGIAVERKGTCLVKRVPATTISGAIATVDRLAKNAKSLLAIDLCLYFSAVKLVADCGFMVVRIV